MQETRASLVVALLCALGVGGCSPKTDESPGPRLVVLFATCTLNRHYLGPYNPEVPYTPTLDAFAEEGTVFSRHHTESGQSGIAFASLLSGTQADRHGVYTQPSRLREEAYLVAEAFAERGFETHFWAGHEMAAADMGYGQGVRPEHVHERGQWDPDEEGLAGNDAEFADLLDRLRKDPSLRVFTQIIFTVTHSPYVDIAPGVLDGFRREFPEEWPGITEAEFERARRRYRRQWPRLQGDFPALIRDTGWTDDDVRNLIVTLDTHYKASVWHLDALFGHLLGSIRDAGLLDESLIAFTADHGETLWREQTPLKWSHGFQLSPDVIQVPLIVRLPGERGLPVYPGVSRSIDVHPTLLGLAGLPLEKGDDRVDGVDLSAALRGREPAPRLRAFSHTLQLDDEMVGWFTGRLIGRLHPSTDIREIWTAVRDGDTYVRRRTGETGQWRTEAFDLAADPVAIHDIFDPGDEVHRELKKELESYKERLVERHERLRLPPLPKEESAERLRSLGYIE
jgi:arylsulfatase A-like enzyme